MPTYEHLLYEKHGGVALLTMNRPEIMNALEAALARDLVSALREAAADDEIGSIVLTGTGKSFSSGGDLGRLMQGFDLLEGRRWLQEGYAQLMGLLKVRKPVIAAVNGYAVGAGFSLALLCDLIIAADTAKFGMAFIKVGAVPDCGALYFLPRLVGLPKAKELVFTGANIDAAEAYRIGIVNRVVPAAELLPEALRLGQQLADGPAVALALAKEILNASSSLSLEQVMELEIYAQSLCFQTEDHKEGVIAFLEKRKPVFKGR
ncbi:MAG TPA: enoyl-CoA hydratase [Bacillota bacterium]|jgi:2-(1,2-epoxy-1,2-dihydrophenyl)acetyl-CoA isomerase|nr:enoyl-CoA hydratase [Bacillota bacterium]HOB86444.1 enoyl-CoA hydratase [Bacillota bacterium]HOP68565.1 enoyl-CoA hydratase [Bacillota bacterium]HPT33354.1 enoyl-CoA hydratase [Bacillota bacterium]HQD05303.1 enoyl-CoA hydratase [Bacillota bacterium]